MITSEKWLFSKPIYASDKPAVIVSFLSIDFSSMANVYYNDDEFGILDFIDNPIRTDSDSPSVSSS